jgi:hypothetical protein
MRCATLLLLLLSLIVSASSLAKVQKGVIMTKDKSAWPEVMGMTGEAARAKLESELPNMLCQVVPYGSMVTMDYREDRIRIYTDESGHVTKAPRVG